MPDKVVHLLGPGVSSQFGVQGQKCPVVCEGVLVLNSSFFLAQSHFCKPGTFYSKSTVSCDDQLQVGNSSTSWNGRCLQCLHQQGFACFAGLDNNNNSNDDDEQKIRLQLELYTVINNDVHFY